MDERDERALLRDEEDRELFAIRREEHEMAAEERALERKLESLADREHAAERDIEAEWRTEHWGRDPGRPPAWRVDEEEPPQRRR